jgi:signal transduction histidine kinase
MSDVEIRRADAIPDAEDSEQARLSHRLEAVGQLAAGIAHEINTPLQFVGDSVKFLTEAVEELLTLTGLYRELLCTDRHSTITITTRLDCDEAIIEIADDGPGIPAAIQDRIYDLFSTTKEVGKGTGQGLALARATIERHAGSLNCVSAPGEGTRFTVRLPVEPLLAPAAEAA